MGDFYVMKFGLKFDFETCVSQPLILKNKKIHPHPLNINPRKRARAHTRTGEERCSLEGPAANS